ncbi:MAG: protocatechuate 3,4-dioxygenase subunit beta [Betaproteobacteria bacterium]|nr:protocatechuate 3,4-dioxygenase subunit beta [Betaproteobacteria bacterium]
MRIARNSTSARPRNMPSIDLYRESEQPVSIIKGYKETPHRNPGHAKVPRPLTLSEVTGPLNIAARFAPGSADMSAREGRRAIGAKMHLSGRVLDESGRPLKRTVLEVWHCNAAGKYHHEADGHDAPYDANFPGFVRIETDDAGRYALTTIKPAPYPVYIGGEWWRPPHVHFSVYGTSFMSRLVTQMYFPGEPLNESDLLLNAIHDRKGRERLIARSIPIREVPVANATGYVWDMVIRGERQTPFVG